MGIRGYAAFDKDGVMIQPGQTVLNFHNEQATFMYVDSAPGQRETGKVAVKWTRITVAYYPGAFNLKIQATNSDVWEVCTASDSEECQAHVQHRPNEQGQAITDGLLPPRKGDA